MLKKQLRKDKSKLSKRVIHRAEKILKRETLDDKKRTQDLALEKLFLLMKYNRGKVERHFISTVVKIMEHPSVTYRTLKYRFDRARASPMNMDRISLGMLYPNFIVPNYVAVSVPCADDDDDSIDDSTLSDYFNISHSISSRSYLSYKPIKACKLIAPPIPVDIITRPLSYSTSNDSLSSLSSPKTTKSH